MMLVPLPRRSLALLCCMLIGACSGAQSLESAQGVCIEGQTSSCTCANGSIGVRRCASDSQYGSCQCGLQATSGTGSVEPTAGSGPVAGDGAAGDTGPSPTAGAGAAGSAGDTSGGSGGLAGSAGTGGMSGGTSGSSGMSGEPIDAGTAAGGGNSGPGSEPGPGELYGPCLDSGSCDDGLLCVSDGSTGTPMSYCTTTCGALGQMRCPRTWSDRAPTCVLGICVR